MSDGDFQDGREGRPMSPGSNYFDYEFGKSERQRIEAMSAPQSTAQAQGTASGTGVAGLVFLLSLPFVIATSIVAGVAAVMTQLAFAFMDGFGDRNRLEGNFGAAKRGVWATLFFATTLALALSALDIRATDSWLVLGALCLAQSLCFATFSLRALLWRTRPILRFLLLTLVALGLQAGAVAALASSSTRDQLPEALLPERLQAIVDAPLILEGPPGWSTQLPSVEAVLATSSDPAEQAANLAYFGDAILALGGVDLTKPDGLDGLDQLARARYDEYDRARGQVLNRALMLGTVVNLKFARRDDLRRALFARFLSEEAQRTYWKQNQRILKGRYPE